MAIEKPYKCIATFRGFGKVLTQKYFYPWNGKDLRVEICNVASQGYCSHTASLGSQQIVGSEFVTKKFYTLEMDILLNIHHTV